MKIHARKTVWTKRLVVSLIITSFCAFLVFCYIRVFELNPVTALREAELLSITPIPFSKGEGIPKLVHQSWKTHDIPETFLEWSQSWKLMNPDFRYVIWDDTENRELIMQHYPWFLKRYESFESPILKADASRIFYLHKYGGIYADLDVVSLRPIAPFIDGHELILGNMRTEAKPLFPFSQGAWNYLHGLPNAWMASRPGHPFWLLCAKLMMEYTNDMTVEELTGPVMIWRALTEYIRLGWHKENSVYIADSRFVFPYSWTWPSGEREHSVCSKQRATFNASKCLDMVDPHGEAFTITYWSHSWEEVIE